MNTSNPKKADTFKFLLNRAFHTYEYAEVQFPQKRDLVLSVPILILAVLSRYRMFGKVSIETFLYLSKHLIHISMDCYDGDDNY